MGPKPLRIDPPMRSFLASKSSLAPTTLGLGLALLLGALSVPACATGSTTDDGSGGGTDTGTNPFVDSAVPDTTTEDTTTPDSASDSTSPDGASEAASEGGADSSADTAETSSCTSGCAVGFWDIDKNPLTGTCGCEYACSKKSATDPIDDKYADDNCDGSDGVLEQCVFVSASKGTDDPTAGGTAAKPMKTINAAIARAKALGGSAAVCVSGETYNEYVQLESGVSVYGGFDPNDANLPWKRVSTATTVITNAGTVVYAPKIDAETHLEGLTLNATAPTGIGASAYGVRLAGGSGTLYVRYDVIKVAAGTPGEDGAAGAIGADGVKGGDGAVWSSGGTGGTPAASMCGAAGGGGGTAGYGNVAGGDGTNGTVGSKGKGGGAGADCYATSGSGDPGGSVVTTGANGGPGGVSTATGNLDSSAIYLAPLAPSGVDGSAGGSGGGAGGGAGRRKDGDWKCIGTGELRGGGGGAGGGGGCGGKGGGGGRSGGGSFGVTAASGTIVVDGCDINVAKGGKGGDGKGGGPGGNGAAGGGPGAGEAGGTVAGLGLTGNAGSGGTGGSGANGGAGGPGSGGAGGPSVCMAASASATVTFSVGLGKNSCVNAGGGAGGLAGTNGGATGAAGPGGFSGSTLTF